MSPAKRKLFVGVSLTALTLSVLADARVLAATGEYSEAFAYAIAIPGVAVYELVTAWGRGPEAADASARMLFVATVGVILAGAVAT